ncbi:MAG: HepT-like ribonuclease domain-containing protein [Acidiferrobacter sp.]
MKPSEALEGHRDAVLRIAAGLGAQNVRVFGSILHGEDTESSDVDLLVDVPRGTTLLDMVRLQSSIEKELSTSVDVLTALDLPAQFRNQVLQEAKPCEQRTAGPGLSGTHSAIGKIQRYVADKSEPDFMADELVQDGVIRNLEIIGEAVTKLSPKLKAAHDDVSWGEISGMRNRLIHSYISVNLQIVWDTVEKVLPDFLEKVGKIQREMKGLNETKPGGSSSH